jgi:glutamate racemase
MKIGILDSGVGGTSIMRGLEESLPEHTYIYYADSDNFPYSTKTKDTLTTIAVHNVELLILQGAQLIVIACNTLTVAALEHLRKTFPHIQFIGTVPAVKKAADSLPIDSIIVVLATAHTAQSTYLSALIEKYSKGQEYIVIGTTDLVKAVEENDIEHARYLLSILLEKLSSDKKIAGVVIGCTHFSFIEKEIREAIGYPIKMFDSIEGIIKQVRLAASS